MRKDDDIDDGKEKGLKKANIELLTDHAFNGIFNDGTGGKGQGKTKYYNSVQTCVKSKRGIGEPIIVKFYAPMNMKDT